MSTCRCCLKPHPLRLIERFNSSIQTIKLLHKNCSIFETILLDEYEHLERITSNINKYLMQYGAISSQIFSYLSQLTIRLQNRLEYLTKFLYQLECLTITSSIWLKNNSIKSIHSQLKHSEKQFNRFTNFVKKHSYVIQYKNNLTNKFWKDFSIFQINYQQQSLQMDSIEREHMKLFLESNQIFFSIISLENHEKINFLMNIDKNINEWKDKNKFRISWLPDEHQQKENIHEIELEKKLSLVDIEIKAIDDSSNNNQENFAYESNLSWSFTIATKEEDLTIPSSHHELIEDIQPSINIPKSPPINRVRLAIEAIEQNSKDFSRERKS